MEGKFEEHHDPETSTPVKVYVRVRPPKDTEPSSVRVVGCDQVELGLQKIFRFDRIFGPTASQEDVYTTAVYPLVGKFFEGINCTIFAYGQTGSGKTYTIGSGCYLGEEKEGIIARTVFDIFKNSDSSVNQLLSVSYLEIYKEELRDLLQDNSYLCSKEIHIREDDDGKTIISGVVEEEVRSVEEVLGWLECGNAARVTSATEMNAHSSRSHAVFTISMVQEKTTSYNDQQMSSRLVSKFHFVDLAGSERVSRTNNVGERFKESIHINGGLLALGNVISALSDKRRRSTHVPYRDSKITRILKDSLGGSALTVMITCLSPSSRDLPESLNALKYAKRARNIKNHPIVNHANGDESALLFSMREEIQCLRSELDKARETCPPPQSAGTIYTVDSSELDDHNSHLFCLKKLRNTLYRERVIQEVAEAAYQQCQDHTPNSAEALELKSIIDNLYETIKSTIGSNEVEEEFEVVSKSTNTSFEKGLEGNQRDLDEALKTIEDLRMEIQTLQDNIGIRDQECLQHVADNEALRDQHQSFVKQKESLEEEVTNLEGIVKLLHDKLREHGRQQQEGMEEICSAVNVEEVNKSLPVVTDIHSILHGVIVTDLQDFDDACCDRALRQLTDILSSRYHESVPMEQLPAVPQTANPSAVFDDEIDRLNENIATSQHQLHHAEKRLLHAQHSMKSLGLKMRFKEELIKELVKNNSAFQCLNKAYQAKIENLEKEYDQLKIHVAKQKSSLKLVTVDHATMETQSCAAETRSHADVFKQYHLSAGRSRRRKAKSASVLKTDLESQEKKLKDTESKLLILQRKRQETLRILKMGERSEKRVSELEGEMERLRNQQVVLKKKLKGEFTRKKSLEEQVQQYKMQVKALSESNRQQSNVIRVKTEEAAMAQRKLRNCWPGLRTNRPASQQWIDHEVEKIVHARHMLEKFQQELLEREAVIKEQEGLLQERTRLQMECNQPDEIVRISQQIDTINQKIVVKEKLKASFSGQMLKSLENEIIDLKIIRDELSKDSANGVHVNDETLSSDQKMRLMELSEQIEVLETFLQIKNDSANQMKTSQTVELPKDEVHHVLSKISALPSEETKLLLSVYVNKVILLKQQLEKSETKQAELTKLLSRQEEVVQTLEQSLDQSHIDKELRLTRLCKEHAKEVQVLLQQMTEKNEAAVSKGECDDNSEIVKLKSKVQKLEKDLYYYKKTTRDLRHELKVGSSNPMSTTNPIPHPDEPIVLKDSLEVP